VDQVRDVGDGQQGYLRAVERAAGGGAGFRGAAAGFLFVVVFAGGFIQQRQNSFPFIVTSLTVGDRRSAIRAPGRD
jgi:hypothetical protein